ncbi:MAG TPA: hypothetical protein DCG78_06580 [Anaerolineaceae bacterium]|nr:hypothetical protein [Anaerolineaceae bacterium]
MVDHSLKPLLMKLLGFWLAFIALHFAYDFFTSPFLAVFSGTSEAVAQHIKMSYFAYTFVSLGEYFIRRVEPEYRLQFLDSRLLGVLIVSLATFLWYIVSAIRGAGMPTLGLEVIYANAALLLVGFGTLLIERDLSATQLSKAGRAAAVIFFLLLGAILVIGSFRVPWGGFWEM